MAVSTHAGSAPQRLTYDDYARLTDGKRYQLIDGALCEMSAPSFAHQYLLGELHIALGIFLRAHPLGIALAAPFDVVLDRFQVVQPDLLYVSSARREQVFTPRFAQAAPDLAVEILSPETTALDLGRKRELYAEFGLGELWILAQDRPHAEVYRTIRKGRFTRPQILGAGDSFATPLLPGFSLAVDRLYLAPPGS